MEMPLFVPTHSLDLDAPSVPSSFAILADSIPVMIWKTDQQGKRIFFNEAWLSFTGRSLQEECGDGWISDIHPDDVEQYLFTYRLALQHQQPFHAEYRLHHHSGAYRWVFVTGKPQYHSNQYTGYVGSTIDITDRKQTEERLESYKQRLEIAQYAGGIGTLEWNLNTNQIWCSEEQLHLFGLHPQLFSGKFEQIEQIILPSDHRLFIETINRDCATHKDCDIEYRILHKDTTLRWIKTQGKFFYTRRGEPLRFIGISYDITKQKQTEQMLRFKAESNRILSHSFRYKKTLRELAKTTVTSIADWCSIDMIHDDGSTDYVALAHADKHKVAIVNRFRKVRHHLFEQDSETAKDLRQGKTLFFPLVTEQFLQHHVADHSRLRFLQRLNLTSLLIVPIQIKGHTIGTISLATTDTHQRFDEQSVEITQQFASSVALAIENATLYEELSAQKERLQNVVANVSGVVWEGEGELGKEHTTFVSPFAKRMVGFELDEWYAHEGFWLRLVHPEDTTRVVGYIHSLFTKRTHGIFSYRWITKKGKIIWIQSYVSALRNEEGERIGIRFVNVDITGRMEIERRKDDFISMASHELKTPLTSIKVFNEVLLQLPELTKNKQTRTYLLHMDRQIDHLTTLVRELLDVTKIQAGKLQLNKSDFSLHNLAKETIDVLQTTTQHHHMRLVDHAHIHIYADRDRIGQVLTNLISNAIKYSPESEIIQISIEKDEKYVHISVKDKGIGIAPEHIDKIFDRFYRVFDATDQTFPGLGIGLYISLGIIKRHKGTIDVRSTYGKGSTFRVTLPL
ncbi:hypothetical protein C5B42_02645 [Candidatus Cerribacteria bacterium 'Amazon FNV 2010 28 9']|uniref:histidine kinase n=1 Tax=Candidatus Cerribacteria bacterium 'Amazon FNV 2010 28 9' TaxID=2081795 RepID=A0A317JQC1_9BACT|nr:MAG: hypothetical protein C5B42_02645 [Candidatus Cerribacteria bacterium 'Amazon FNV 2010 28 9']